jgi:hypothetical protein
MENKHRIANLKAILRVTRKDLAVLRLKAREAGHKVNAALAKSKADPAHPHLYISEVGLAMMDKERAQHAARETRVSISKLRLELRDLLAQ